MKLSELIISIVIFVLIGVVTLESFTIFEMNYKNTEEAIFESEKLIQIDNKLRTYIGNINIPYWKNKKRICDREINKLMELDFGKKCEILSANIVEDEKTDIIGISIIWKYRNRRIETKELFL